MQHIKISESVPENKTFVMSKWCHQPRNVGNQWTWNMQHMMCDGWSSSWGRMKDKKKTGRLHRCVKYLRGPLRSHKDCTRTSWPHTGRREEKSCHFGVVEKARGGVRSHPAAMKPWVVWDLEMEVDECPDRRGQWQEGGRFWRRRRDTEMYGTPQLVTHANPSTSHGGK